MKKILFICTFMMLFIFESITAQIPTGFNYQAVVRDNQGNPVINSPVEVIFTIRASSPGGSAVWEELYNTETNSVGSIELIIGGNPSNRTGGSAALFTDIDWSVDSYFLQVSIDGNDMGASQIMSVPYAAWAENVVNDSESWTEAGNNIFFDQGNVSIGSESANSRLTVQGDPNANIDTALFEVKNINGDPVFAVYNEGVRIYIEDSNLKGLKGGFAVGGYNSKTKAIDKQYMFVTPDSVRVNVNESSKKGIKGGFAVGGYNSTGKSTSTSFMQMDPKNYFIGHEAGANNTLGLYNSFFGYQAGTSNIVGSQNIFIGYNSGFSNTSGRLNTFIGNNTGYTNTTGFANVFIGDSSGYSNIDGQWNVFVGEGTGVKNTTGWSNVFIGDKAGKYNENGGKNVFLGSIAGWKNIDGNANVFIGTAAGSRNISGSDNTFMGSYTGRSNTTGNTNIYIGRLAGYRNTTGSDNIYIGSGAGYFNDTTYSNIFIGNNSGEKNTGGFGNVFLGNRSGAENVDGSNNTILGHESAHYRTSGSSNTILGAYSGFNNFAGYGNVFVGSNSGENSSEGSENTYIGTAAGFNATGNQNVFIGAAAGFNEKGSGKLYISNSPADSSEALIYGDFLNNLLMLNGKIGINTTNPWNDLHVSSKGTYAKLMVGERDSIVGYAEFAGAGSGPGGGSLRLGTSGDFDDANQFWQMNVYEENLQIGPQNNQAIFIITKDGEIIHRGTQLHADYVFKKEYELESIESHSEYMWAHQHLPSVPKATYDDDGMEVVDLGARNRGVLEELEKAHIYIEQLNRALKEQQQMIIKLQNELDVLKE